MATVKEEMIRIIEEQPDDSSYDEIFSELALRRMIERGLADSDAGRVLSDEEMERRAHQRDSRVWLAGPSPGRR